MAPLVGQISKDLHTESPRFATWIDQLSLGAGVAATYTFPANVDHVEITYTAGKLYSRSDGSAAVVPAATIVNGTGSQEILNGANRQVEPSSVHSFINATACVVSFACSKAFVVG